MPTIRDPVHGGAAAAVWAFSRPHTIIGTTVSVLALWIIALASRPAGAGPGGGDPVVSDLAGTLGVLAVALVGALATNVFIVGVNQVTDVDIDRINKPYLPLASGALSPTAGRAIVWGSFVAALAFGAIGGPWLLAAFGTGVAVGSAYSLPPLRLKRFPVWAAASVSFVRGVVVNVFMWLHFSRVLLGRVDLPARILLLAAVVTVFGLVIAWFKDVPDVEGDRRFGIRTLSLSLGGERVLRIGLTALAGCQVAAAVAGVVGVDGLQPAVLGVGVIGILAAALFAARRVDFDVPASFVRFYLTVWGLFYAEYVVFTAAALAA